MCRAAFYDRERAEVVALHDYEHLGIGRGEVIRNPTHVHPSLEKLPCGKRLLEM